MEKFIIATGKTIDLAVENALNELHLDRDSVSVEVLENAKRGILGIGSQPAKIKVTYHSDEPDVVEAPKSALSSASRSPKKSRLPEKAAQPAGGTVLKPKNPTPPAPAAPKREPAKRQEPQREQRKSEPKPERKPEPKPERKQPEAPQPPKEYPVAAPGSTEEKIEQFLKGLLEHMGSDAVPHAVAAENDTYLVDLVGEHLGMLIGRRGETLDAIQHICNYAVNHGASKRVRVKVDAESYRQKREESLQRLALKVAGKVAKYHRNVTLEPMNAYERHVIHAVLQDHPQVCTYSIGAESNRRVVVAYGKNAAPKQ